MTIKSTFLEGKAIYGSFTWIPFPLENWCHQLRNPKWQNHELPWVNSQNTHLFTKSLLQTTCQQQISWIYCLNPYWFSAAINATQHTTVYSDQKPLLYCTYLAVAKSRCPHSIKEQSKNMVTFPQILSQPVTSFKRLLLCISAEIQVQTAPIPVSTAT